MNYSILNSIRDFYSGPPGHFWKLDEWYESLEEEYDTEDMIDNAIEWITDLAENNFVQTRDTMSAGGTRSFCCLGVADYTQGSRASLTHGSFKDAYHSDCVGLLCHTGDSGGEEECELRGLTALNDDLRYTFPQIAAHLLEHLHDYFQPEVADGIAEHFWGTQ